MADKTVRVPQTGAGSDLDTKRAFRRLNAKLHKTDKDYKDLVWRGEWATEIQYKKNDLVTDTTDGSLYICILDHPANALKRPYGGTDTALYWEMMSNGSSDDSLSGLSDTNITSPSDLQILTYNNSTSKWVDQDAISDKSLSISTSGFSVRKHAGSTTKGLISVDESSGGVFVTLSSSSVAGAESPTHYDEVEDYKDNGLKGAFGNERTVDGMTNPIVLEDDGSTRQVINAKPSGSSATWTLNSDGTVSTSGLQTLTGGITVTGATTMNTNVSAATGVTFDGVDLSKLSTTTSGEGSALIGFDDSGNKTTAATVADCLDELYLKAVEDTWSLWIPFAQSHVSDSGSGTFSDSSVSVTSATDPDAILAANNMGASADEGAYVSFVIPPDLDITEDVVMKFYGGCSGTPSGGGRSEVRLAYDIRAVADNEATAGGGTLKTADETVDLDGYASGDLFIHTFAADLFQSGEIAVGDFVHGSVWRMGAHGDDNFTGTVRYIGVLIQGTRDKAF